MKIRFWGTRGSIPSPGPRTNTYGGNTSCVEVLTRDGTRIILDCGTGARDLGLQLASAGGEQKRLNLFIGHVHWDHIQGFPFFVPAFLPNTELNVYAPRGFQHSLDETLAGQMQHTYFPVRLSELQSRIHFTHLEEGFFRIGDVLVETQHLNHTAPTIAYRISADGATVVYSTDHEPFWQPGGLDFRHPGDQRHIAFLEGADLVIHDAQYLESEYPQRIGWGHSTVEYAADAAVASKAHRLALFHHDPMRDDAAVAALELMAQRRAEAHGSALEVFAAAEGTTIEVGGRGRTRKIAQLPATMRRPIAGRNVLVIGASDAEWSAIEQQLVEDNLVVERTLNLDSAIERSAEAPPDLVVVSSERADGTAEELIERLRNSSGAAFPAVILSERLGADPGFSSARGVTDYVAKPFSPPMLRARVRVWLGRAASDSAQSESDALVSSRGRRRDLVSLTREEISEALRGVPVFRDLGSDEIDLLTAHAAVRSYATGQLIIRQGDRSTDLFVLLSGSVRVVESVDGSLQTERVLGELRRGEVFGEMAVLTGMPRSATVVAAEPIRCLMLPGRDFLRLVHSAPGLSGSLVEVLSRRIFETDRRVARYGPDPLTGLQNRWTIEEQYPRIAAQAKRRETGVLLILVDIVKLRTINDRFGYTAGDKVIEAVSQALQRVARQTDLVARYGGDEFVFVPVDANEDAAGAIVRRLQKAVAAVAKESDLPAAFKCAIGVTSALDPPESIEDLVRLADADLQKRSRKTRPAAPRVLEDVRRRQTG